MEGRFFEPTTPHFFKIILSDTIQNGKLSFPKKFVRKHGSNLSRSVLLKVVNGDVWKVELERGNDRVWLQGGWPDFINHYSIEHGHFLVFGYGGNSLFYVVILDKSASEIDYPIVSRNDEEAKLSSEEHISPTKEETEAWSDETSDEEAKLSLDEHMSSEKEEIEDLSDETSDEDSSDGTSDDDYLPRCRGGKRKDPTSSPRRQPSKVTKRNPSKHVDKRGVKCGSDGSSSRLACRYRVSNRGRLKKDELRGRGGHGHILLESGYWRKNGDDKYEVLQRASAYESAMPFFVALMQPSYVQYRYVLNLPSSFFMEHVSHLSHREMKLYAAEDGRRIWSVRLCSGIHHGRAHVKATRGWKEFAKDNGLVVGDVCVLELMSIGEASFKVTIFRANEESSSAGSFADVKLEAPEERNGSQILLSSPSGAKPVEEFGRKLRTK